MGGECVTQNSQARLIIDQPLLSMLDGSFSQKYAKLPDLPLLVLLRQFLPEKAAEQFQLRRFPKYYQLQWLTDFSRRIEQLSCETRMLSQRLGQS